MIIVPTGKRISKADKDMVVEYYKSKPMTFQNVADKFGYSLPTIGKILSEYKIKTWDKFRLYSPGFRESYFETIDSEKKAYFLGLLTADGNVYDGYKTKTHPPNINLTLQDQDSYILDALKNELRINKNATSDGRGCYQLSVFSKKMAKDLSVYSIVPNKSFTTIFPDNLPADLYRHYVRGFLDGDGSVGYYARPGRSVHMKSVRFCSGSYDYLKGLVSFFHSVLDVSDAAIWREKEKLWSIAWRRNDDLEKIIHWLYDDATIYFSRKKEKCDLILKEIGKYRANHVA